MSKMIIAFEDELTEDGTLVVNATVKPEQHDKVTNPETGEEETRLTHAMIMSAAVERLFSSQALGNLAGLLCGDLVHKMFEQQKYAEAGGKGILIPTAMEVQDAEKTKNDSPGKTEE
jgi:hypothetical protein